MFKQVLETKNITPGINTCKYIILHHTGTKEWTIQWNINVLTWKTKVQASVHYIIDVNWDIYKIWNHKDILRHAGLSNYKWLTDLNKYSIWIEVIWPLSDGWFTNEQKESIKKLVTNLCNNLKIPKENILRHKDITTRKVDIADTLWNKEYKSYNDYIDSFFIKKSKYTDLMNNILIEKELKPIFSHHTWDNILTEQEVRELIEIWLSNLR